MDGELYAVVNTRTKQDNNLFLLNGDLLTQQNTLKVLAEECPIYNRKRAMKVASVLLLSRSRSQIYT